MAGEQAHDYQGQVIAEFLDAEGVLPGTFATPLLPHVATGGWAENHRPARCRPAHSRCG